MTFEDEVREFMRDMRSALHNLFEQQTAHEKQDEARHVEASTRLTSLERQDAKQDLAIDDTGKWTRDQLVTEKRKWQGVTLKLIFAMGGAILGLVGARFLK